MGTLKESALVVKLFTRYVSKNIFRKSKSTIKMCVTNERKPNYKKVSRLRILSTQSSLSKFFILLILAGSTHTSQASLVIEDTVQLSSEGQNMWQQGPEAVFTAEYFLGTRWGNFEQNQAAERVDIGKIFGKERYQIPGTGGTVPNPARIAYDTAWDACKALGLSDNICKDGRGAVQACAPSWLGGGCQTVVSGISGLGTRPDANIDNPIPGEFIDTRTGIEAGLETSGEAGVIPWVEAKGGSIDADIAFKANIVLPEKIVLGEKFTIDSSLSLQQLNTKITAKAPSFAAGVDGLINSENRLFGKSCFVGSGCVSGSQSLDLKAGRFGIINIDTAEDRILGVGGSARGGRNTANNTDDDGFRVPGIGFEVETVIYSPTPDNPDGIDDEITPKSIMPSPRMGDFMISNPTDLSGGTISGENVNFTTNQQLLSLNASISGMAERIMGSLGVLSNKLSIAPKLDLQYTILDVAAGPRLGVQQNFNLSPNTRVKLFFDKPLVVRAPSTFTKETISTTKKRCLFSSFTGFCIYPIWETVETIIVTEIPGEDILTDTLDFALGESVEALFSAEIGNLIGREYYIDRADFTNNTSATIDPGFKVQVGCANTIFAIAATKTLQDGGCSINEDFKTSGLVNMNVYEETFGLGGFNNKFIDEAYLFRQVPEPETLFLFGAGMLLLCGRNYRRSR